MMNRHIHNNRSTPRTGFTLVEILVVIGIIALLITISMAAMAPLLSNARAAATKTTLNQLGAMVQLHVTGLLESDQLVQQKKNLTTLGMSDAVADALSKMHAYRLYIPQREKDMYGLDGVIDSPPGSRDDSPLLAKMWDNSAGDWKIGSWKQSNTVTPNADSSELLYLILSSGAAGGLSSSLELDQINPKHIGDTDQDGNLEFIDAWGNPLQFYNWPTRLFQDAAARDILVTAETSAIQNSDPFDPTGALANATALHAGFPLGGGRTAVALDDTNYKDFNTYWAFMIISAGPDGELGFLGYPNSSDADSRLGKPDPANADAFYDNLSNRQQ